MKNVDRECAWCGKLFVTRDGSPNISCAACESTESPNMEQAKRIVALCNLPNIKVAACLDAIKIALDNAENRGFQAARLKRSKI